MHRAWGLHAPGSRPYPARRPDRAPGHLSGPPCLRRGTLRPFSGDRTHKTRCYVRSVGENKFSPHTEVSMRLKFFPVALALSVAVGALGSLASPSAWAKGAKAGGDKEGDVPDAVNRQFKWEEGVVGPNDKKLDRKKIAAMQEAARKEDAKHKNEPTVKKAERPAGVGVPASSTLPTMDIEKAAPVSARTPKPRPVVEKAPPKTHDSLDDLLDSESKDTGGG